MYRRSSLDWEILRLFKRAKMERRRDVAEHLMRALETSAADDAGFSPPLAEAYSAVGRSRRLYRTDVQ